MTNLIFKKIQLAYFYKYFILVICSFKMVCIWYNFGIYCYCREIMDAMWKPEKFKGIYLMATVYVLTLTLPSAAAVYWAFGDLLLNHSNAFALLPKSTFRDLAVVLMLIHQVFFFNFILSSICYMSL